MPLLTHVVGHRSDFTNHDLGAAAASQFDQAMLGDYSEPAPPSIWRCMIRREASPERVGYSIDADCRSQSDAVRRKRDAHFQQGASIRAAFGTSVARGQAAALRRETARD